MIALLAILRPTLAFIATLPALAHAQTIWIGTFPTEPATAGIYRAAFDPATGELSSPTRVAELPRATFLTVSAEKKFLFAIAASTTPATKPSGKPAQQGVIASFQIKPDLSLTPINTQTSGGVGPCHVSIDATSRTVFVSNYGGGSIASYRVQPEGQLEGPVSIFKHSGSGPHPKRQDAAHIHSAVIFPDNRHLAVCDLGADLVHIYALDPATSKLTAHSSSVKLPPGSGPRHLAFHPTRPLAFVINELDQSLSVLSVNASTGTLTVLQTLGTRHALSPAVDASEMNSAEVRVHPNGRFIYTSTRDLTNGKRDYLTLFSLDEKTDSVAFVELTPALVSIPRNFNLSPCGRWLLVAGQKSNTIAVFALDPANGKLTPHGTPTACPSPTLLHF